MKIIDGTQGYGQVLRTAIALSSLTLEPIKVINIRQGRERPGLMPQHVAGIKTAAEFCDAEVKGLEYGSTEIEYVPKKLNISSKTIDIGTSGSIGLLLQTLTPIMVFTKTPVTLEITGGSAGLGSPTIEYLDKVTFQFLARFGITRPAVEILRQGFYPKGGGRIKITFLPNEKLNAIQITERGGIKSIKGISISGSLPDHVAIRQKQGAERFLREKGYKNLEILYQTAETLSQGTSITLWAEAEKSILGADSIGRRGLRAEDVGRIASEELHNSIESQAVVDKYLGDQIIPFMALAEGKSAITVEEITQHLKTNISVTEQILGVKFQVRNRLIVVDGIGFSF